MRGKARGKNSTSGNIKILSLFTGAGGLDLGFQKAGYKVVWANEFDGSIRPTFKKNFPGTTLDERNIVDVKTSEIPRKGVVGIIGGPPCQSWSEAGSRRGLSDDRGKVFLEYARVIKDLQPLFFLAENVSGILHMQHGDAFKKIIHKFEQAGYVVNYALLNAADYNVPQNRNRVIIVGYNKKKIGKKFEFPKKTKRQTLKDAIWDIRRSAVPAKLGNSINGPTFRVPNHEYMVDSFSYIYMSRNRVRDWNEQSFTIQANGRHTPIHPSAPKMKKIGKDKMTFVPGKKRLYRRLSVRECARIQTFPDSFIFKYKNITDGYKMIGNAVPVNFAKALAIQIKKDIKPYLKNGR